MFDYISLQIGRIIFSIIIAFSIIIFSFFIAKGASVLFSKLYSCIKKLLPWEWLTEEKYSTMVKIRDENPKFSNVKIIRKGRFGNLYIPNKTDWWDTKNHYFYIKKS